jgi:hypothetical protein
MATMPTLSPPDPRGQLLTAIKAVVERGQEPKEQLAITYRVSGGPPTRRLQFVLEVRGTGAVTAQTTDELEGARSRAVTSRLARDRVSALLQEILNARLLENIDTGGGFLPDSIVGSITVADGPARITYYYLADEEQQRNQDRALNPSVARVGSILEQLRIEVIAQRETGDRQHKAT